MVLRSVLCKNIEGTINVRLLDYFHWKEYCREHNVEEELNDLQWRKFKRTMNLSNLSFFDMEKACDSPWRHGILKDSNEADTTWRVFNFTQNFPKPNKIKSIWHQVSWRRYSSNKGDGLCFFLHLKIDKIVAQLPIYNIFQLFLYMDVLKIFFRCSELKIVWKNCIES